MADSCLQGPTTCSLKKSTQTAQDLILNSLENLSECDFKKFRNKLSDLHREDELSIPRGKLEKADHIDTMDLLIRKYGQEEALDVAIDVFTHIGLMGPANDLRERRSKSEKLKKINKTESRLKEWKKKYMESVKEDFQKFKEPTLRRGETIHLNRIYTTLRLIRRSEIMEENEKENYYPTTIQTLFDPDEDGLVPKIVVLQGPAGIGKTMTSRKIMLDWASGNLYQDKFVFYLSCRKLNNISTKNNLVGLLSTMCKLENSGELESILKDHEGYKKLLFIVDGFDELRCTLQMESEACHDVFEEADTEILLQRLLRKQVLKQSSLIITTRSMALEKLHSFVEDLRHVEIQGFTEEDRKAYFHTLFRNRERTNKALSFIKDNDTLNTMCAVPFVCWIVCTVLKPKINQDIDLHQFQTATSIYLLYLKGLIKSHAKKQPEQTSLKKLWAMAKEGILNHKILFEVEDLKRHGLSLSEVESLFLNEKIFSQDIETQTYYSFIHLSVQEFLTALFYVLDDGSRNADRATGSRKDNSIPEICKGDSLNTVCIEHPHLSLAVRFLFGLLNEKEVCDFSKRTGFNVSLPDRHAMHKWLLGYWTFTNLSTGTPLDIHSAEVISCMYETQDKDTISGIFSHSPSLELTGARKGSFWTGENCSQQLCYCIEFCKSLQNLSFVYLILDPKYLEKLSSLIHRCQMISFQNVKFHSGNSLSEDKLLVFTQYDESPDKELELICSTAYEVPVDLSWLTHPQSNIRTLKINHCGITASSCNHISSFLRTSKLLTSLDLSDNKLRDSGVKILCEGLRHAGCKLQELRIWQCSLTPLCCDDLHSLLISHRSLISLDLSTNPLRDSGIKRLCEGLRDPACALQQLKISGCGLTSVICDDLQSVLIANRSLIKLELSFNFLEDPEIKLICEGFKHPNCTLQQLSFRYFYTLETDVEFSEADRCFEDLQRLGYLVFKDSTLLGAQSESEAETKQKQQFIQVDLWKPRLQN